MPLPPPRCAASVCLSLSPPQSLTAALPPLIARCQCVWLISPLVLSSLSLSRCLCSLSASLASPVLPSPWPACDSQMQRPLSPLSSLAPLLSCCLALLSRVPCPGLSPSPRLSCCPARILTRPASCVRAPACAYFHSRKLLSSLQRGACCVQALLFVQQDAAVSVLAILAPAKHSQVPNSRKHSLVSSKIH